jgi:hypothetical protein
MLWHLTLTLALRAIGVRHMQLLNSRGLQLQLGYVGVDDHEVLLVEQDFGMANAVDRPRPLRRPSMARGFGSRPAVTRRPPSPRRRGDGGFCPCWIARPCNAPELSVARSLTIQVIPYRCAPLFSVHGTPPEPPGITTDGVGNGVLRLNTRVAPRKGQHSLRGCSGRLECFLVGGACHAPLLVSQACAAPRRLAVFGGIGGRSTVMPPLMPQFA